MATVDELESYFQDTLHAPMEQRRAGAEIETFFVNDHKDAISLEQSQRVFGFLVHKGWSVAAHKGSMITELTRGRERVQYELGYPNIELAVSPQTRSELIPYTQELLAELYYAARSAGAYPLFEPIYKDSGSYLAVPDDRDAAWLTLDGKAALSPLATISAVQFTVDVSPQDAMHILGRLLSARQSFLDDYPQDATWRTYVRTSNARYREDRFGGPATIDTLRHYCQLLSRHSVITGNTQVSFEYADLTPQGATDLFLRSIWWYFRLRRYGSQLCIEVRPLPRRSDTDLEKQFAKVSDLVF